jgi:hypothetical protein
MLKTRGDVRDCSKVVKIWVQDTKNSNKIGVEIDVEDEEEKSECSKSLKFGYKTPEIPAKLMLKTKRRREYSKVVEIWV